MVGLRTSRLPWLIATALTLSVSLGALWAINSWDYPSYLLLSFGLITLSVLFSRKSPHRGIRAPGGTLLLALLCFGVLAVSLLSFWPFHQFYETFNNGLDASRWRTPIDRFLGIHGLFLFVIVTYLLLRTWRDVAGIARSLVGIPRPSLEARWLRLLAASFVIVGLFFAVLGYWNAFLLTVCLALLAVAGFGVLRRPEPSRPYEAVVLLMVGMALLIAIGVDFVTVEGDIGRMNTLFKYYLEVWILLAIASAYMLWRLGAQWLPALKPSVSATWLFALALLIGCSLVYVFLGTRDRLDDRFVELPPTLDGTAYMTAAVHWEREQTFPLVWDREAIRWLQDNVEGSPVVLEAHMEQYRWGGRIANYTGLPTILGWPWHQIQQRFDYREQIGLRAEDVKRAYNTTSVEEAVELMRRYEVSYVVVGELERLNYDEGGLRKFEEMAEAGLLDAVYRNEGTAIFRREFP